MKVIVTGGKGFIGSHMVEFLLNMQLHQHYKLDFLQTHETIDVTVIDDESANENLQFYEFPGATYVKANVIDPQTHELYKDVDYVFHFAARSRIQPSLENPYDTFMNNTMGTQSVLQASRNHNVRKVIYSSSSSVYAQSSPPHVESMSTTCLNPYSLSKHQGEQLCNLYQDLWGLKTVVLRYFNVYGPREPLKGQYAPVVGIFKRQRDDGEKLTIVGDGEQRRDFTYVKDVANANWLAALGTVDGGVYNIGTGKSYSINEVAAMVGGDKVFIASRPAEARETLADITRAKAVLNWSPRFSLSETINTY